MNSLPANPLDRFELLEQVGAGSEAVVFRARDRHSGDEVAVKTFSSATPGSRDQLRRDFRAICELAVPELPRMYELFEVEGRTVVVMELFAGEDVERLLGTGRLEARAVARGILRGLAAIHERGLVHGDVKPSNVFLRGNGQVVLGDLGLSRRTERGWNGLVGTPAYFSPERMRLAPATPASDLYGAGVILHEVLCGADLTEQVRGAIHRAAALGSRVTPPACDDAELAGVVAELLDPDPKGRRTAQAMCRRLGFVSPTDNPWVGRRSELAFLDGWWRGHAGLAIVMGPSGIGKTGLVRQFASELRRGGVLVLHSRCHPNARVPFHCFESIVDDLAAEVETLSGEVRGVLHAAFPFLAGESAGRDSRPVLTPQPGELARGLRSLLATIGRQACWVIDDVQWMDADSERVLLGLTGAPIRILLVGKEGESSLLARLAPDAERLTLGPLNDQDVAAWLGETTPLAEAEERNDRALRAGGSPFLLKLLSTAGPAMGVETAWRALFAGLSAQARSALELLAVVGVPMKTQDLVAAVSDPPRWSILWEVEDAGLIQWVLDGESRRVLLSHARVAEVIGNVDEAARRDILRRLEQAGVEPLLLASLYRDANEHRRCATFAWPALKEALRRGSFSVAIEWCRYLLESDADVAEKADVLDALARAWAGLGRPVEAARILEQACEQMSPGVSQARRRASAALLWLGAGHAGPGLTQLRLASRGLGLSLPTSRASARLYTTVDGLWLATHGWKLREQARPDAKMRARLEAAKAATGPLSFLDYSTAVALITRYLRLALAAGDVDHACRAAALAWNGLAQTGKASHQREGLCRFLEAYAPRASREVQAFVESTRAYVAIYSDRLGSSLAIIDRALALYDAHRGDLWDLPFTRVQRLIARHFIEPCSLEWADEVDRLRDGLEEAGNLLCSTMLDMGVGYAADLFRGSPDAARARLERARSVFDAVPSAYAYIDWFARARIALYEGRLDVAAETVQEPPARELMGVQHIRIGYHWVQALVATGRAARGDSAALRSAEHALERLRREHGHYGAGHADGIEAAIAACKGQGHPAREAWQRAVQRYADAGLRAFVASAPGAFDPAPGWHRLFWPFLKESAA